MSKGQAQAGNPRAVIGGNHPPDAPAARTPLDIATDAASSTLWGGLCGVEVELDGDLRAVGMTLDKTIDKYLRSIVESEGEATASTFAKRLRKTLNGYIKELEAV